MAIGNRLLVVIDADVKGAIRELDKLGGKAEGSLSGTDAKIDKFANGAIRFGAAVSAGAAVAGVGLHKAAQQASDLNESITKSDVVFGKSANSVVKWAGTLADSFGLSKREALEAAGGFGSMFRTTGLAGGEAAKMSKRMTELAGDMASFNNEDPTDMLDRLRSGLAGEAEPLRRFGVLLSEARVQSFAYANGIAKAGEKLTEAQKVQARYGLILKDTKLQQGDFARTADGAANSQRAFKAQIDNLVTSLGQGALPVLKNVTGALAEGAGKFNEFDQASGGLGGKIATIGTVTAGAVGGISLLAGTVAKMNNAFAEGGPLAGRWGTAVKGLAAAGAVLAAVAVVDQLVSAIRHVPDATEQAASDNGRATGKLVKQYKELAMLTKLGATQFGNGLGSGDSPGLRKMTTDLERFKALAKDNIGTAERLFTALQKPGSGAKAAGIDLDAYKRALDNARASQGRAAADAERGANATQRHARATEEDTAAVTKNQEALDNRRTALLASFNSEIAAAQSVEALGEVLGRNHTPLEANAALMAAAGDKAQEMSDKLAAAGVDVESAATKNDILKQALTDLKGKYPELTPVIDEYIGRLNSIPTQPETTPKVNTGPAMNAIDTLITRMADIKDKTVTIQARTVISDQNATTRRFFNNDGTANNDGDPNTGGGRALGGSVLKGKSYVVGERGPEVLTMGANSGWITPNNKLGGGGNTYIINVNSLVPTAATGQLIREHLHKAERAGVTTSSVAG